MFETIGTSLPSGEEVEREDLFVQFLNPEILRLYGARSAYNEVRLLSGAIRLARFSLVLAQGQLLHPATYIYEVPYFEAYLNRLKPALEANLLAFVSESADLGLILEKKQAEYRSDPELFAAYTLDQQVKTQLVTRMTWVPRTKRSASSDISRAWVLAAESDEWEGEVRFNGKPMRVVRRALISVPERLEGQAFVSRIVRGSTPELDVSVRFQTSTDLLMSRIYLASYLSEANAFMLTHTPFGRLDCGVPEHSPWVLRFDRCLAVFGLLGVARDLETGLSVAQLVKFRARPSTSAVAAELRFADRDPSLQLLRAAVRATQTWSEERIWGSRWDRVCSVFDHLAESIESVRTLVARHDLEGGLALAGGRNWQAERMGWASTRGPSRRGSHREPRLWDTRAVSNQDVFLVHGRNGPAVDSMRRMLQAATIVPVEWEEAVGWTGSSTPYTLDVIKAALRGVNAVVVLFTPDEEVALHEHLQASDERDAVGSQSRPNVFIETGMVLGAESPKVVIVEIGQNRPVSDVSGLNVIRFNGSPSNRKAVMDRLESLGCDVRGSGYLETPFEIATASGVVALS